MDYRHVVRGNHPGQDSDTGGRTQLVLALCLAAVLLLVLPVILTAVIKSARIESEWRTDPGPLGYSPFVVAFTPDSSKAVVGYKPEGDACCALTYTYTYTYDVRTGKQVSKADAGRNGRGLILKDPWSDTANNGMYARISGRGDIIEIFPSAKATGGAPRVITPSNPYSDPARGEGG